ncbi:low-density lipoprotein receptor-related protein 2-like isoform X3 [Asterias rubens]|uniref:low-density lipoprotein receptor-related protein 2-like isoform X3 n=1 Tax=Asterias rubens TaxID=7604 RepID=UPI001455107D|nr:low-density lipoprotein receptor-related protein 2-like isoform X3 [Asterias rubens]
MRLYGMRMIVLAVLVSCCLYAVEGQGSYDLALAANINPPGIFVASTDTFNFTSVPGFGEGSRRPVAIDYDPVDGMVYWTDVQHGSISRSLLDGSSYVVLLTGLQTPDGLTLDLVDRVMYWTDTGSDLIEKATMDGLDRTVVLNLTDSTRNEVQPRAIVVDSVDGIMFWTDWGSSPKIERANTDGTSRRVLVDSGLLWPNGLALDVAGGRLYWCDAGLNTVESVDFEGGNRLLHANVSSHDIHPFDIWYYRDRLFWTDWISAELLQFQFSPPNITGIGSASFSQAAGLHIYKDELTDHSCIDLMPCAVTRERCRQFDTSYQCVCKDGSAGAMCNQVNPCSGNPCNDGECFLKSATTNVVDYFCQCPLLSTGMNCETQISPCQSEPCMNEGTCFVSGSRDTYVCLCTDGFTGVSCENKFSPYNLVFVANIDPPGIYVAQADNFNFTIIPGTSDPSSNPVAVDYDPVYGMVYWTDTVLSRIVRSFLDGSGLETIVNNTYTPDGLSLDPENRVMYWTDTGSDLIEKATMDGLGRTVVLNLTDSSREEVQPRAIIVDTVNSYLFWTDWGTAPKIERANTDGSDRRVLVDTGLGWPNGLSLDSQVGRLYWCDASLDRIEYSDLDGNGRSILVDLTVYDIHPFDVAVYDGFVYWTDWRYSLLRTSLDAATVENYGTVPFQKAGGLHIYEDTNVDHSCQTIQPCQNFGFCQQYRDHYECICLPGYTGFDCENGGSDMCDPQPCLNGGSCLDLVSTFLCLCPRGYSGETCSEESTACLSQPCMNGGSCEESSGLYFCYCLPGFTGDTCSTDSSDVCSTQPCMNGGTCHEIVGTFYCICDGAYAGDDCSIVSTACSSQPCMNGGSCEESSGLYFCYCLPGFTGDTCSTDSSDVCSTQPCMNGGTCHEIVGTFYCICDGAYAGNDCSIESTACLSQPCMNGGSCEESSGLYFCYCLPGFTGDTCSTDIDECNSDPCQNGATCVDRVLDISCTCSPGFTGFWCQINLNECASNPCLNGGTCVDLVNAFSCACSPGWMGVKCDININECSSSPCLNGGTCVDLVNAFSCACSPGWVGVTCDINIYECNSDPCQNGATCVDLILDVSCTCVPGFTGYFCEINFNECASSPCLNGGTCVDAVNAYSCACSPGWMGVTCDINAVDCTPTSCLNGGTCVDGVNSFTCTCLAGYTGSRCDLDIDECLSSPCMNGATCVDEVNRFSCTCPRGFEGDTCATDIEPPTVTGCPFDTTIPVTMPSSRVTHSWTQPGFTDNSGPPSESFGCSSTGYNECHQSGSGLFSVGITKVMYNVTDGARNRVECSFTVAVTVVDIVCPMNVNVLASPGDTSSSVDWNEPVITGWNGPTSFTSTAQPGTDTFLIGTHQVNYTQRFAAKYNVVLECSFFISVGGQCDDISSHDSTLNRTIKWQPIEAGKTAESFQRCTLNTTNAGEPIAIRDCLVVDRPLYFEWEANYTLLGCGEASQPTVESVADQVEVTEGNAEEVAVFIADQTQNISANGDEEVEVEDVADILSDIASAGSGNPQVTNAVVETVNNILTNPNTNDDLANDNGVSSSGIVQSVEAQISSTLQQEDTISIQQPSLHVEGVSLDPMEANGGYSFVSVGSEESASGSLEGTEVQTFNSTSDIPEDVEVVASIQLPQNIGELLQSGDNSSQLQVSFIVYASDDLFQSSLIRDNNSSVEVAGPVVSLTVEGHDLVNLTEPLVIEIQVSNNASIYNDTSFRCVFWDFTKADGVGDWSTAGCVLARQTDNTVSCNCNHATNFAILVDVKGQKITNDKFALALDVISQIGIVLSIIALGATLIIYLSIKKLRSGKSRLIFIHFCASLLLLYIVFLAGIDSARGSVGACAFVAALLHYLALTTMMWMAVEARNMYVSTVKVFPEDTPKYMLKACLIAWGSPAVLVTITLASGTSDYGSEHNCFVQPSLAMYLGLLVPIGLILLHNIITFILVMRSLLQVQEVSRSQQISKRLQNAIGISALMGLTWVFGFLAIGDSHARFAFQLIFCLANSLQGVVVCIMFCIRREEVRTAMEPYWRRICCGRTCSLPVFISDTTKDVELVTSTSPPNSPSSISDTAQFDLSVSGPI